MIKKKRVGTSGNERPEKAACCELVSEDTSSLTGKRGAKCFVEYVYKVGRRPDLSADEVRELLAEAAVHMRVDHEDFEAFFRPDCAMLSCH